MTYTKKASAKQLPALRMLVGVTRFELATSRPPDAHSNRTELHPVVAYLRANRYSCGGWRRNALVPLWSALAPSFQAEYALLFSRGLSCKAMQSYALFRYPPNFSAKKIPSSPHFLHISLITTTLKIHPKHRHNPRQTRKKAPATPSPQESIGV